MVLFRKAVLIIHGFAGGIYDEEHLANCLEKRWNLDVYLFTLPGHEKLTFKTVRYQKWIEESENQLKKLIDYGYKNIYIVGHSMGGVIATYLATKYKEVKKLVLAAPAFTYLTFKKNSTKIDKAKCVFAAIKKNEKDEILTRFLKLPLTSINEFVKLINLYSESHKNISIPLLILHGKNDTIVPVKSSVNIYNTTNSKNKKIVLLDDEGHDLFKFDESPAISYVEEFLK